MAAALQIIGAILITIAIGLILPPAGIAIAGVFCIIFGVTIELNKRRD